MSVRPFLNIALGVMLSLFLVTSFALQQQLDTAGRDGRNVNLARRQEVLLQHMADQARMLRAARSDGAREQLCGEFNRTVWLFDATMTALENGGTVTDDIGHSIEVQPTADQNAQLILADCYTTWAGLAPSLLAIGGGATEVNSPSGEVALQNLNASRDRLSVDLARSTASFVELRSTRRSFMPLIEMLASVLFVIICGVTLLYINGESLRPVVQWFETVRQSVADPASRKLIDESRKEMEELRGSMGQVVDALNSIGNHLASGAVAAAPAAASPAPAAAPKPAPVAEPTPTPSAEFDDPAPASPETDSGSIEAAIDEALGTEEPPAANEPAKEVLKQDPSLTADGGAWGADEAEPEEAAAPEAEAEEAEPATPKNLFVLSKPSKPKNAEAAAENMADAFDKATEADEATKEPTPPAAEATPTEAPASEPESEPAAAAEEPAAQQDAPAAPKNLFVLKKPSAPKTDEAETKASEAPEAAPEAPPETPAAPAAAAEPEAPAPAPENTPAAETAATESPEEPEAAPAAATPKNLFVLKKPKPTAQSEQASAPPEAVAEVEEAVTEPEAATPEEAPVAEEAPAAEVETADTTADTAEETPPEEEDDQPKQATPKNLFVLNKK